MFLYVFILIFFKYEVLQKLQCLPTYRSAHLPVQISRYLRGRLTDNFQYADEERLQLILKQLQR